MGELASAGGREDLESLGRGEERSVVMIRGGTFGGMLVD